MPAVLSADADRSQSSLLVLTLRTQQPSRRWEQNPALHTLSLQQEAPLCSVLNPSANPGLPLCLPAPECFQQLGRLRCDGLLSSQYHRQQSLRNEALSLVLTPKAFGDSAKAGISLGFQTEQSSRCFKAAFWRQR